MTAFFIPGLTGKGRVVEEAYVDMRKEVQVDTGRRPSDRRILQLSSRRGGADCLTEVGRPDPVRGGMVLAIFDLGSHRPFVVQREGPVGARDAIREVLSSRAYSVREFES